MLIPVIVVLAVVVLAGGYWAWQRWQAERTAQQFLKGWAALGGLSGREAEEYAKQLQALANESAESEVEEAQTPEQAYNAAEEVSMADKFVQDTNTEVQPILAQVFGGAKLTEYFSNYFGMGEGTGMAQFTLKRMVASGDGNKLTTALIGSGYTIISSGKSGDTTSVMAEKNSKQYTFSFDDETQEIAIVVFVVPAVE